MFQQVLHVECTIKFTFYCAIYNYYPYDHIKYPFNNRCLICHQIVISADGWWLEIQLRRIVMSADGWNTSTYCRLLVNKSKLPRVMQYYKNKFQGREELKILQQHEWKHGLAITTSHFPNIFYLCFLLSQFDTINSHQYQRSFDVISDHHHQRRWLGQTIKTTIPFLQGCLHNCTSHDNHCAITCHTMQA